MGPIIYKVGKKEEAKAYIVIFTCAVMIAIHLEVTKSQTAEEFIRKLNAFIARKERPAFIIFDNGGGGAFIATAEWINKLRKSESLLDFLGRQESKWNFNLSKSPWWGAIYERIIKDIKTTLHKTVGHSHLSFEQLESIFIDIECHLNNLPLTYIETEVGEGTVLTPTSILWGQNAHTLMTQKLIWTVCQRRLEITRTHA